MKKSIILITLIGSLAMISCGGNSASNSGKEAPGEYADAPEWVLSGGSADGKEICGVGTVEGTKNLSLARTSAYGRARTAIARMLNVKVKSMLKDYQATTTGGEQFGTASNDEQHIVDVSKQITDINLSGTEERKIWISKSGKITAGLVCLATEKFKNTISQMSQLDEAVRAAVVERADKSFSELDEATKKAGSQQ